MLARDDLDEVWWRISVADLWQTVFVFLVLPVKVHSDGQVQGNDNALRKEAEKRFTKAEVPQPGTNFEHLFAVIESTQVEQPVREQAAGEPSPLVRRQVADVVQSLGNQIIAIYEDKRPATCEQCPELMPMLVLVVCDTSKDAVVRVDCIWTVEELAISVWQVLSASGEQTMQVLKLCLADADSEAVGAYVASFHCEMIDNTTIKGDRAGSG